MAKVADTNSHIIIVPADNRVGIDNVWRPVDCAALRAQNKQYIVWEMTSGRVDYINKPGPPDAVVYPPIYIDDFSEYQPYIDAWNAYTPPEPPAVAPWPPALVAWSDQFEAMDGTHVEGDTVNGRIAWDNFDLPNANTVFVNKHNNADSDVSSIYLVALQADRVLRIEARGDAAKFVSHTIVEVRESGTELIVTVTPLNDASMPFTRNEAITMAIYLPGYGSTPAGRVVARKKR